MDNYFAAKRLLFAPEGAPPPQWSVINADDPRAAEIHPAGGEVLRYGFGDSADLKATDARNQLRRPAIHHSSIAT